MPKPGTRRTGQRKIARRSARSLLGNFVPNVRLYPSRVGYAKSIIRRYKRPTR